MIYTLRSREHRISPILKLDSLPMSVSYEKVALQTSTKGAVLRKEQSMKSSAGLWIDHSQTIVVTLSADGEKTEHISSDIDQRVRFSGGPRADNGGNSLAEDQQDRRFGNHLSQYYDKVIEHIRDADAMLIFGPGEAKGELQQRLARAELSERIVGVETADKMTDRQIAAKVRQYFATIRN